MFAFGAHGCFKRFVIGALVSAGTAATIVSPAFAQTRTLVSLSDVPVFVPAPYPPQTLTAYRNATLYDSHLYYGSVYLSGGVRYWH